MVGGEEGGWSGEGGEWCGTSVTTMVARNL